LLSFACTLSTHHTHPHPPHTPTDTQLHTHALTHTHTHTQRPLHPSISLLCSCFLTVNLPCSLSLSLSLSLLSLPPYLTLLQTFPPSLSCFSLDLHCSLSHIYNKNLPLNHTTECSCQFIYQQSYLTQIASLKTWPPNTVAET